MGSIGLRTAIQLLKALRIIAPIIVFLGAAELSNDIGGTLGHGAPFSEEVVTGTALLGCMFFPFGTYLIVDGLRSLLRGRDAVSWPVFAGEVLSSEIEQTVTYALVLYSPRISYRYDVNGQHLEGDTIQVTDTKYLSERAAQAKTARYPVGAKVEVHVNPEDVVDGVLETGSDAARRRVVLGFVTFFAPFALGLLFAWYNTLV
jgi:Protein of unknown function (DUF3592)